MKPLASSKKVQVVDLMSRMPFFEDIPEDDLMKLAKAEQLLFFAPRDEEIMTHGEQDDGSFYLVLSGILDVYDVKRNFIRELKGGAFLGEIAFITKEARTANVIIHEDAILMRITQEQMLKLPCAMRDKLKDRIITGLADRVLSLNKTCTMLYQNLKSSS